MSAETTPTISDGLTSQTSPQPHELLNMDKKPATAAKVSFIHSIVGKQHNDLILIACAFCSGLIDASMFAAYTTFVSMQTGNTVFIALATSNQGPQPDAWLRPFLAVLMFACGAIFFSRMFIYLGHPRRRLTLVINFSIQATFVMIAAALTQSRAVNDDVPNTISKTIYPLALAPISLLAFQSAGQITASRALEVGELPTVVITSLLCDLFSDPHILAPLGKNLKRNRRVAGFLNTFIGAVIGGWMARSTGRISGALWLATCIKTCMAVAWTLWPAEHREGKDPA